MLLVRVLYTSLLWEGSRNSSCLCNHYYYPRIPVKEKLLQELISRRHHTGTKSLDGEKLSRIEGLRAYPSYPGRANFSYISLQNLANRLHEKQKVGSARRVTRLAGLPFCDGRVTLLAGPTFLHINTLARLAGSTRIRRDDQSMRELCCYWKVSSWLGQRGRHFSHVNAR